MKKTLLAIFTLSFFQSIYSQDSRDTLVEKALLWEISGNGLTSSSYMYGTHHLSCEGEIILPPIVLNTLQSSKIFYIENLYAKGAVDSTILSSKTKNGIKDLLGRNCYRDAKKLLESYYGKLDDAYIDSLSTTQMAQSLLQSILRCRIISYDDSLYNLAKKNKLELRGLETMQELRDHKPKGIEFAPTRDMLCSYVLRKDVILTAHIKRRTYYNNHDINWLYNDAAYYRNGDESNAKAKYLDGRNRLWIPRIESAMKENITFFAFGCAHLPGRRGIISLLRQKGYTVTPLF